MKTAPWGVRLACRLLQERGKGALSEWAPYLALIPPSVPASPLLYTEQAGGPGPRAQGRTCWPG